MTAGEFVYLITADDSKLNSSLSKSEKGVKSWGNKLSSWTVAKGQMIANFATKAVTRVGSMAKGVFKETLNAYKTFEQLEGGTRLLFENSADAVFNYAKTAYQRVQMSQNEYLEQANSFATGLKTSLNDDAQAAADLADKIITAQADVIAATGASQEAVQNAFRGLMRGNYTMLDNLQLGITPTKKGMEDLIKTVNDWNKERGKATKYQMGNLADMQSALVDYIDKVGMAGYADKEARGTIEGSMASTKAAWQDLLVAFGSGKDVKQATKNFAKSAKDMFRNMLPVFRETIHGIGDFVQEIIPEISSGLDDLIKKFQESDNPVLQGIGNSIAVVRDALNGLTKLVTDFPGTIQAMEASDSPALHILAEVLSTCVDGVNAFCQLVNGDYVAAINTMKSSNSDILQTVGDVADQFVVAKGRVQEFIDKTLEAFGVSGSNGQIYGSFAKKMSNMFSENVIDEPSMNKWLGELKSGLKEAGMEAGNVETVIKHFQRMGHDADPSGVRESLNQLVESPYGMQALLETWQKGLEQEPWVAPVEPQMDEAQLRAENSKAQAYLDADPLTQRVMLQLGGFSAEDAGPNGYLNPFGHAKGEWNVPYDNYPSLLHRGEMVLTASQARRYRDGSGSLDYAVIGDMIGSSIERAMGRVNVLLSGDKVGDLTTRRIKRNINAQSASVIRGMGG